MTWIYPAPIKNPTQVGARSFSRAHGRARKTGRDQVGAGSGLGPVPGPALGSFRVGLVVGAHV